MEHTFEEIINMEEKDLPSKYIVLNYETKKVKLNRDVEANDKFMDEVAKVIMYLIKKWRKRELALAR
jgi:hypothetical protein